MLFNLLCLFGGMVIGAAAMIVAASIITYDGWEDDLK